MKIFILMLLGLLTACDQQKSQDFVNAFSGVPTSSDVERHKQQCKKMGFEFGGDNYGQCMMRLYDAYISARAAFKNKSNTMPKLNQPMNCVGSTNGGGYYNVACH